jgi:hypothetical protein
MREHHIMLDVHSTLESDNTLTVHRLGEMMDTLDTAIKSDCRHNYAENGYVDDFPDPIMARSYCDKCGTVFKSSR